MPSLRQKPDGRWYVDYYVQGKRKRRSISPKHDLDEAQAETIYSQWLAQAWPTIQNTTPADSPRPIQRANKKPNSKRIDTLAAWYLDEYKPTIGCVDSTIVGNRITLRLFCDHLAEFNVHTWQQFAQQPTVIDSWRGELLERYAQYTVRLHMVTVRAWMRACAERFPEVRQTINELVLINWHVPRVPRKTYEIMPKEVAHHIYEWTGKRNSAFSRAFRFLILTGWRPVDVCNLQWSDVEGSGATMLQKTGEPLHVIVSDEALQVIEDCPRLGPHVFTTSNGGPINRVHLVNYIKRQCKTLGHPEYTAKSFRELFVTTLIEQGYDREVVRKLTGHTSDAIADYIAIRSESARTIANVFLGTLQPKTDKNSPI